MIPPQYLPHRAKIREYIEKMGVFALTQEIRFAVNESEMREKSEVLEALERFQSQLSLIQHKRIAENCFAPTPPLGVE